MGGSGRGAGETSRRKRPQSRGLNDQACGHLRGQRCTKKKPEGARAPRRGHACSERKRQQEASEAGVQ